MNKEPKTLATGGEALRAFGADVLAAAKKHGLSAFALVSAIPVIDGPGPILVAVEANPPSERVALVGEAVFMLAMQDPIGLEACKGAAITALEEAEGIRGATGGFVLVHPSNKLPRDAS